MLNVLAGYIGGTYSSNMNRFSKLYRVMVQAAPEYRLDTESLKNMFVRNSSGEMSPVSQYLTLTRVYGAETLSRFNRFAASSGGQRYSGQRIQLGTGHTGRTRGCGGDPASRLRIRVRRYVA